MSETCTIDDCGRPAHRSGLCRGHYTRHLRGQPVAGPLRPWGDPARTFAEAMFAFADAASEDDAAYYRAWKRACTAGRRYFRTK